ncbi:Bidirectional sugar transporter SWEET2b [Hibiscus syriacus]|uniref:Bidirectional sugar transporter SWEET2b n=1 Tax=Hibiscus syriacus TaxID=106335 RepID=A0A6A2Y2N2_HIBSY|nr:Bidirectional sugar transporter SWEET2b [Hibiscus syriacus]
MPLLLQSISFLSALCSHVAWTLVLSYDMRSLLLPLDDWVATGSFWLSGSHSCWKLADSRPRNAMDLCWVIKLCFSRINVCFPVVYNQFSNSNKSVEFMPFYLSLSTFLLSTSFFLYGIFNFDAFIYVPNGIGTVLGILQLRLYFYYKTKSVEESREPLMVSHA